MAQRIFQLDEAAANGLLAAYQATNDGAYRTRLQAVRLYGLGHCQLVGQVARRSSIGIPGTSR